MSTRATASKAATVTDPRHCRLCGKPSTKVSFRSATALKCVKCDAKTADERREYHRLYHAARSRAIKRLIDAHPDLYKGFLAKETKGLVKPE